MSPGASELSRAGRPGRDDRTAAPGLTQTRLVGLAAAAVIAVGTVGVYRYVENYWLYRGFAPPHDAAFVKTPGATERFYLPSRALGGRRQPVDVYLPPGYRSHPDRRYPVMYLLHGFPGRPDAFLATVRLGVVEDELVALHRAGPMILVMPFGSTGSFTDKEWANGIGRDNGWETFVARDLVDAVDHRYRTVPRGSARILPASPKGATARSTSASTIRASSRRSRAGRATWSRTTSARSSATGRDC